jgi:hypothetical protein
VCQNFSRKKAVLQNYLTQHNYHWFLWWWLGWRHGLKYNDIKYNRQKKC